MIGNSESLVFMKNKKQDFAAVLFLTVYKQKVVFGVPCSEISSILRRQTELLSSRQLCETHHIVGFVEEENRV